MMIDSSDSHNSCHMSQLVLIFNKLSCWHPASTQSWWMLTFIRWLTLVCPCIWVERRTPLMNSSLLVLLDAKQGPASWIYSKQHAAYLCSYHLDFSSDFSLKSKWYNHIVVLTQFLFYQRYQIFICLLTCQYLSMSCLCICWHRFQLMRYCNWIKYLKLYLVWNYVGYHEKIKWTTVIMDMRLA